MSGIPENLDWVVRRSQCSVVKIFETLRLQIEGDIQSRNDSLSPAQKNAFQFGLVADAGVFSVYLENFNAKRASIAFKISEGKIIASMSNGDTLFEAVPTISDDGKCRLKVNGSERELWHVRKMALEDLFFPSFLEGKQL
jgi:hypothetical protein